MSFKKNLGKSFVLLLIIIILILGGLLWFDKLGVVHVKSVFAPVYRWLGKEPQVSTTETQTRPLVGDLDQDRIDKQKEAINIQIEELEKRESDLLAAEQLNAQIASELEERQKNQEEIEKTFNSMKNQYDDKNKNIEQVAINLNGMKPQNAVNILLQEDDQFVVDVLRKCDEMAARDGTTSLSSYWLSLMPADRAARIQRKQVSKPDALE